VTRRDLGLLLLLSAIWGSSFLFIKLGVDELEPSVVVLGRTVVGVLVLLPLLAGRGGLGVLRGHVGTMVALGALNNALPFWLLGFANTRIDSGLSAVIQAAAPVFTVVLASWIDRSQRVRGTRLVGVGVGLPLPSGGAALVALAIRPTMRTTAAKAATTARGARE